MSEDTPFRSAARKAFRAVGSDYIRMQEACDRARSHGWWRNLLDYGAWGGLYSRVGPPDPGALEGIAKLFGTTAEQVAALVAADWYRIYPDADISARALRLGPTLDLLTESDAELLETIARRLSHGSNGTPPPPAPEHADTG